MTALTTALPVSEEPGGIVGGISFKPARLPSSAVFDPVKHLAYREPPKQHTMTELHLANEGISDVAVTEPFPLFTREAIVEMRRDVLSDKVLDEYCVSSNIAKCQAREYNKLVSCCSALFDELWANFLNLGCSIYIRSLVEPRSYQGCKRSCWPGACPDYGLYAFRGLFAAKYQILIVYYLFFQWSLDIPT